MPSLKEFQFDADAWRADPALVRELETQFQQTLRAYRAKPELITEHANHEESIRVGGYANRTLLELVQNAADALSSGEHEADDSHGRVEIVLDSENEVLYCANAGSAFTAEGITAITMAHLSAKRGDEIGRFGLGFKSVLAVSAAPEVFSRSISFGFNSKRARNELGDIARARRYPVLRTAVQLDPTTEFSADPILAELSSWASTIVKLPSARNLESIAGEIRNFVSEFLLFVSAVRTVQLRIVGAEPFTATHRSRILGQGWLRIEGIDGEGEDWLISNRMHSPSPEARQQVGEAVSRSAVKVTVGLPAEQKKLKIGQFWSYFPLQDKTSASALLNAPWSVNDDRTTLLRNDYNREILKTVSEMFVELLPRLVTKEDPAAHLDFMPARGRETHGFGDELLTTHIPVIAASETLIPDATGKLCNGSVLRPLDLGISFEAAVHESWSTSPNTGDDVPHWRSYTSPVRAARLRDLFLAGGNSDLAAGSRDFKRALELLPKRGLLSWLREWAEGADPISAANALRTVARNGSIEGIEAANVIPTSAGMRSLLDNRHVFLQSEEDLDLEQSAIVDPDFLRQKDVERILQNRGFRKLDPQAILLARVAKLTRDSDDSDFGKLWDSALDLRPDLAARLIHKEGAHFIKVPTRDGKWVWPKQVLDLDVSLDAEHLSWLLDRQRCVPEVAHKLGVVTAPIGNFPIEDEQYIDSYQEWVLERINKHLAPGERYVKEVELSHATGPGPFSTLLMLRDSSADPRLREKWTTELLAIENQQWTADELGTETGRTFTIPSPSRWAVEVAGLVNSNRGFRAPSDVVAPSLIRYKSLLPLYKGPRNALDTLKLPDELEDVPEKVLREMLESPVFPGPVDSQVLVDFVFTSTRLAFDGSLPRSIPARVRRTLEARPPSTVYIATTDEEESFLLDRDRAYLRAAPEEKNELVRLVGCRSFEDSFSFSMIIEGEQLREPVLDLFTGLRNQIGSDRVANAKISRAELIVKRVTTEDGVEDQPMPWHLDGSDLIVTSGANDRQVLQFVGEAFGINFDNAQLDLILKTGQDHRLEALRIEAKSAPNDVERLEMYIGDDDLREGLPTGLWSALKAQGLVGDRTSMAELFLTVYGSEALERLRDSFSEEGFNDVPSAWTGQPATISWVRKMGFDSKYAGRRSQPRPEELVVPGAVKLKPLHTYQKKISEDLRIALTQPSDFGPGRKAMVELPTGAGKTRVATHTALRLFADEVLDGTILWIAQSAELCEQAVQTFEEVWRSLENERPLTIGRLWSTNKVHEPDTELSVVVATDAKLDSIQQQPEYEWLSRPTAVFIDEAHRSGGSARYTRLLKWLGVDGRNWQRPLIGLSATPFKGSASDTRGTESLAARFGHTRISAFEENAYEQLVQIEVLAKVRHEILPGIDVSLSAPQRNSIESTRLIDKGLYEEIGKSEERMRILVDHILSQDPEWPILVFTPSVLSAQVLAASLRYRGVEAAALSGQTSRQERRDVIRRFKQGAIRVLANCDLLVQGFDAPGVRALYIARPTFSPSAYIQMAGRGLRGPKNGGKEECLIVDVADNWGAMNDFLAYQDYKELWKEQQV